MHQYIYEGPVTVFGRCINNYWYGFTYAVSERKARANLEYQYKKQTGKSPNAKVELPGKVTLVE